MATKSAVKWTCAGCGVAVTRMDGSRVPMPDAWTSSDEGVLCLGCRRERAAAAAIEAAPAGSDRGERAKLRRDGLIEFELRRTPDLTNGAIARTCRSSAAAVAAARRRIGVKEAEA